MRDRKMDKETNREEASELFPSVNIQALVLSFAHGSFLNFGALSLITRQRVSVGFSTVI